MSNLSQFFGGNTVPIGGIVNIAEGSALTDKFTENGKKFIRAGVVSDTDAELNTLVSMGIAKSTNQYVREMNGHNVVKKFLSYSPTADVVETWTFSKSGKIFGPAAPGRYDLVEKGTVDEIHRSGKGQVTGVCYEQTRKVFFASSYIVSGYDGQTGYYAGEAWFWSSADGYNWNIIDHFSTHSGGNYPPVVICASEFDLLYYGYTQATSSIYSVTLSNWTVGESIGATYNEIYNIPTTGSPVWAAASITSMGAFSSFIPTPAGIYFSGWGANGTPYTNGIAILKNNYITSMRTGYMASGGDPGAPAVWYFKGKYFFYGNTTLFNSASPSTFYLWYFTGPGDIYGTSTGKGVTNTVAGANGWWHDYINDTLVFIEYNVAQRWYTSDGITWTGNTTGGTMTSLGGHIPNIRNAGAAQVDSNFSISTTDGSVSSCYDYITGPNKNIQLTAATPGSLYDSNIVYWNSYYWVCVNGIALFRSTDARTWQAWATVTDGAGTTYKNTLKVVNSKLFLITATAGTLKFLNNATETVFTTFTPNISLSVIYDIDFVGTRYVFVGSGNGTHDAAYNTSMVSTGWTGVVIGGVSYTMFGIVSSGSALVAFRSPMATGNLYYSADGVTWNPTSPANMPGNGIGLSYVNSKFYYVTVPAITAAPATSFVIYEAAAAGATWTTTATVNMQPHLPKYYYNNSTSYPCFVNNIVYSSTTSKYYLLTMGNNVIESTNLTTWTPQTVVTEYNYGTAAYQAQCVSVANNRIFVTNTRLGHTELGTSNTYIHVNNVGTGEGVVNYIRYA